MKLIALTGPDGCGKDTQITLLKEKLNSTKHPVEVLSFFNGLTKIFPHEKNAAITLRIDPFLRTLSTESRLFFIAALIQASLDDIKKYPVNTIVLYNGYYYKYWASELTYGANQQTLDNLAMLLPPPDDVYYINTDLHIILDRKQRFSGYETGFATNPEPNKFYDFQLKVRANFLNHFVPATAYVINGNMRKEDVSQQIWLYMQKTLPEISIC